MEEQKDNRLQMQGKALGEVSKIRSGKLVARLSMYLKTLDKPVSLSDIAREAGCSKVSVKKHLKEAMERTGEKFDIHYIMNAKVIIRKV
jgi:hypothetical protein